MKDEYIESIKKLLDQTEDVQLLDLIFQLLHKSVCIENASQQMHEASA